MAANPVVPIDVIIAIVNDIDILPFQPRSPETCARIRETYHQNNIVLTDTGIQQMAADQGFDLTVTDSRQIFFSTFDMDAYLNENNGQRMITIVNEHITHRNHLNQQNESLVQPNQQGERVRVILTALLQFHDLPIPQGSGLFARYIMFERNSDVFRVTVNTFTGDLRVLRLKPRDTGSRALRYKICMSTGLWNPKSMSQPKLHHLVFDNDGNNYQIPTYITRDGVEREQTMDHKDG
jgi:hypothetical protein